MDERFQNPDANDTIPGEITQLLQDFSKGNDEALGQIMPLVYQQLRAAAGWYLKSERQDHTLQATALINEVYLRMVQNRSISFENRLRFFSFAGQLMRRILVDYGRARIRQRRGGGAVKVVFDESLEAAVTGVDLALLVALDKALLKLEKRDQRQSRIVELRYFCGLTFDEISEALQMPPTTVKREFRMAKHWLARELDQQPPDPD